MLRWRTKMPEQMLTGAAGFLSKFQARQGRLPGDSTMRAAAAEAFRLAGLPGATRQQRLPESWKYTSLRALGDAQFADTGQPRHEAETVMAGLNLLDAPALVFVDGKYRQDLSTSPNVAFARFADTAEMGTLTWPDREPMVALNTMLATDGASLHIPSGTDAGVVQLISITTSDADIHTRHCIRLDTGARLTLLEISAGRGAYLLNSVAEFHVADNAYLTHIRCQAEDARAFHISTSYADIAANGAYDSFTLNMGAWLSRTEVHTVLSGLDAIAHLNAAQILDNHQHSDFTTVVRHAAPSCTSRQTVKNVLSGQSHGVFQGRIEVAQEAQKTDGYQMNQALLLSPDAEVNSKPELEIFADDVKCSHGATIGELDADQMFYLQSRGVPEAQARAMLVRAFLSEALNAVGNETARTWLEDMVETWWAGQHHS